MKSFQREEGLSEVIGFILLIGLLVVFLVLYQTYSIPVQGRDNEIDHMNDIKDTLVAYKISLDSLWVNKQREGTMLSTTLDLGTGGGYSRGGAGDIGFLTPVTSGGSVGLNQRDERVIVTGTKDNYDVVTYANYTPGALEYHSNNNYWIDQNYYYQLGGVFLEQDSGSTVRVMPPLSITKNQADPSDPETASFDFTVIKLSNEELISGMGPVRIDTNLKREGYFEDRKEFRNITVSVISGNSNTRSMWNKLFRDALVRYDIDKGWYKITNVDDAVTLDFFGPEGYLVEGKIMRANYTVTLQTVATGIT